MNSRSLRMCCYRYKKLAAHNRIKEYIIQNIYCSGSTQDVRLLFMKRHYLMTDPQSLLYLTNQNLIDSERVAKWLA